MDGPGHWERGRKGPPAHHGALGALAAVPRARTEGAARGGVAPEAGGRCRGS